MLMIVTLIDIGLIYYIVITMTIAIAIAVEIIIIISIWKREENRFCSVLWDIYFCQ